MLYVTWQAVAAWAAGATAVAKAAPSRSAANTRHRRCESAPTRRVRNIDGSPLAEGDYQRGPATPMVGETSPTGQPRRSPHPRPPPVDVPPAPREPGLSGGRGG